MRVIILSTILAFCGICSPCFAALKGVGGIDTEPPAWTEFSNVVNNPGFESVTDWRLGSGCSQSSEQAASGEYSLKCIDSFGISSQKELIINSAAKRFGIKVYPGPDATGPVIVGVFNTSRGTKSFGSIIMYASSGAKEWKDQRNLTLETWNTVDLLDPQYALSGMAGDKLQFRIYGGNTTGTWYFDDAELIPVIPLVRTFITHPNFRGYLWSDWNQTVTGIVEANAPEGTVLSDYRAVVTVHKVADEGNDTLAHTILLNSFTDNQASFTYDATSHPDNTELIFKTELQLKSDSSVISTFSDWRVVLKNHSVRDQLEFYFATDNKLVRNGKKRFIYGVYDRISGIRGKRNVFTDKDKYLNNIAGFNGLQTIENYQDTKANTILYFSPMSGANPGYNKSFSDWNNPDTYDLSQDSLNPWIEQLNDHGASHLHIINHLYSGKKYRPPFFASITDAQMWQVYASYPKSEGFLGWYAADEPDLYNGTGWLSEGMAWDQREVFVQYDKYRPTLGVMYGAGSTLKWRDLVDVIGSDPYPLGRGGRPGDNLYGDRTAPYLFQVNQWTEYVEEVTHNSRPHWVVLQLWQYRGVYPSYDDLKKMGWKAIISGADGILWWGFVSGTGLEYRYYYKNKCETPPCDPNAYPDYKKISNEIMDLEHVITQPNRLGLASCNNNNIDFITKVYDKNLYILASNKSEAELTDVVFTINDGVVFNEVIEAYSENRFIPSQDNSFPDTFESYGIHIYHIPNAIIPTIIDRMEK